MTLQHSGLKAIYAGGDAARYFHVAISDPRHPDIWGVVQHGVVYTGKTAQDRRARRRRSARTATCRCWCSRPARRTRTAGSRAHPVQTIQIAPTILRLLGLDPSALQAVQIEHTQVLPGLR